MNRLVSRFERPSTPLEMRSLLQKARKTLWWALALALGVHVSLTRIAGSEAEQKAAKPLTTQFVKRAPRLTKPLELKKRPQPKRRQVQREMVAVQAKARQDQRITTMGAAQVVGALSRPRADVSRIAVFRGTGMEPQEIAQRIESAKEPEHVVSMSLDMMDMQALDTGRYHAMVIQDPTDKRNIKGFFRLKYAYSESQMVGWFLKNDWRVAHALRSMIEGMNDYTDIKASYEGKILFTSREMLKIPWVFMMYDVGSIFAFSDGEASNLGKYLMSGGFLLSDAPEPPAGTLGQKRPSVNLSCARSNFKLATATQHQEYGRHWAFEILPNHHPLFHCYFDFEGAPGAPWDKEHELAGEVEGITVDGRLLLAMCQKAFIQMWGDPENPQYRSERMIQFGINTIIFALTQEGSVTHRLMDSVQ